MSVILILSVTACGSEPAKIDGKDISVVAGESGSSDQTDAPAGEAAQAYVAPEMKGEISINVYESTEWLESAAQMFIGKYPDMKVNIHDFYNGTDVLIYTGDGVTTTGVRPTGQTREDYISQLNTQLLSGEADDIVITSIGLPIGRYIKMGVFEDLSRYLKSAEEINESNYYMNIFDACRTEKGAIYQFPISAFAIPSVRFDSKLIDNTGIGPASDAVFITWREALDLGKKMYDASTLPNTFLASGDAKMVIGDIFTKAVVSSINYDTGKAEIDRDKMLNMLAVIEELKNYKMMPSDFDFNIENHIPYAVEYAPDVEEGMLMLDRNDTVLPLAYDDGKVYLSPYFALDFGITSQSENKELAWEFLKFLVSEEVQTLPSCPYSGVNKNGLKARLSGSMSAEGSSQEDIQKVTEVIDGWIMQINAYRPEDTELIQLSEGALNDFADGKMTAEETIDTLTSRLEQYMNE